MPDVLVVGIDPDANALRQRSAAAARRPDRGGLPNALFLVASAETLPHDLSGIASEIRVTLPWGALLRGATAPEPWFAALIRRLPAPRGRIAMVLSVVPSDHLPGMPQLDAASAEALAARYRSAGLSVHGIAPVTGAQVAELGSSWAKRLGIPTRREAWRIILGVDPTDPHPVPPRGAADMRTGPRHGDAGPSVGAAKVRERPCRSRPSTCERRRRSAPW
jgi:16S rRNA (adenine(1408)-N(1))-methyltransferase